MFINFIGFVATKFLLFSTFYLSERQKGEGVKRERNAVEGRRHARPVGWPVPHCPQQPGSGTGILDSVCLSQDRQGPQNSSSTCCPWRGRSEENGARKRSWDLTRPWDRAGRHPEEWLGHVGTPAPARSPRLPASPAPSVSSSWPPSWPELFVGEPGPSSRPPGPSRCLRTGPWPRGFVEQRGRCAGLALAHGSLSRDGPAGGRPHHISSPTRPLTTGPESSHGAQDPGGGKPHVGPASSAPGRCLTRCLSHRSPPF